MTLNDIAPDLQEIYFECLNNHLDVSIVMLEKDGYILPMLRTISLKPESNLLVGLHPKEGKSDVDKALLVAIQVLKDTEFENAIFSYSTKIKLDNDTYSNIVTYQKKRLFINRIDDGYQVTKELILK